MKILSRNSFKKIINLTLFNKGDNEICDTNFLSLEDYVLPDSLARCDSIDDLNLPLRVSNALKSRGGIKTVGDLCDASEESLVRIRNIGTKMVEYLKKIKLLISEKYGELPEINENKGNGVSNQTAATLRIGEDSIVKEDYVSELPVTQMLGYIANPRALAIISRRYGLIDGDRHTLEEIGEEYRLTRERIRQIQVKALKKISNQKWRFKCFSELMEKMISSNGGVITDEEADTEFPKYCREDQFDGSSVLDLLCDLSLMQNYRIGDIKLYSTRLNGVSLEILSNQINDVVKSNQLGVSVSEIVRKATTLKKIKGFSFSVEDFVSKYCSIDPRVEVFKITSTDEILYRHYSNSDI